ncbi:MAG TPA: hypothetical protein PLQ41_02035 [bacterium]|nr:hypothetical protein [bacterium]HPP29530.1 hypothetical protein [bacterium]
MRKVRYHLRFQIIPGNDVKKDAMVLANFCIKHHIEEVVLFFAGEEWNNGLLSKKEEDVWFETVREATEILKAKGISVSLNPWMTVLHCDRGRRFPSDYKFKPMVSPLGEKAKATASFADKNWQKYINNLYGRFATLGFRVIWIEDDFRYHNHAPLTWGGGFEDEIIERFSKKIGTKVSREEVVKKILQPGSPHPWREKWMDVWREVQLEVSRGIRGAVEKSSKGKTKLGLMSSLPSVHSIEGRRWLPLFNALTIENRVAHRPHFAPYHEDIGKNKVYSIMLLDTQKNFRPSYCEVAPEIENFPFTTWSKSDTQTWCEMALSLFFGSDALLLNLFSFVGNPPDKNTGKLLDRSYKSLEWISKKFSKKLNLFGVGIPWKENAAEKVETEKGESLYELQVDPLPAWKLLLSYGISACSREQSVNAIFGNSAWIFEDSEILEMLKEGLLLDGESARILCKRGFERYLGVKYDKTLSREESPYSLEVVVNRKSGVDEELYDSVNLLPAFNVFKVKEKAEVWTDVITPEKKVVGPGIILYQNDIGGRTAILNTLNGNPVMNFHRQAIVQNIVKYLYKSNLPFPLITGTPHLLPMFFKNGQKEKLVIFNGIPDPGYVNIIPHRNEPGNAVLLKPFEKPHYEKMLKIVAKNRLVWKNSSTIPYMSFFVVEF